MVIWKVGGEYLPKDRLHITVCLLCICLRQLSEWVKVTISSINNISVLNHTLMAPATNYLKLLAHTQVVSVE